MSSFGPASMRPRDGEHLTLAAGEGAGARIACSSAERGERPVGVVRRPAGARLAAARDTSSRFSLTVRFGKAREPDGTSERPLRTRLNDGRREMSSPASRTAWRACCVDHARDRHQRASSCPAPLRPRTATASPGSDAQVEVEDDLALSVEGVERLRSRGREALRRGCSSGHLLLGDLAEVGPSARRGWRGPAAGVPSASTAP